MSEREESAARNEATFRSANERLKGDVEGFSLRDDRVGFICECSNARCTRLVEMTLGEYEAVRQNPARFFVSPGHEVEFEEVVETNDRFNVVEKGTSESRMIAEETDPRGTP